MIIDSSAIIAVLRDEPERARLLDAVLSADSVLMSAATWVEAAIVVDRRGDPVLSRRFDELLTTLKVRLVEVTPEQARIARAAYRDFGKASGQGAALNSGDCFSYALAKDRDEPLLFTGEDFARTDVRAVPR